MADRATSYEDVWSRRSAIRFIFEHIFVKRTTRYCTPLSPTFVTPPCPSSTRAQNLLNCFTALPVFGSTLITLNRTYSRSKISHVPMLANIIWSSQANQNRALPAKIGASVETHRLAQWSTLSNRDCVSILHTERRADMRSKV